MAQDVKRRGRVQLRNTRGFGKRSLLMARTPWTVIVSPEDQVLRRAPGCHLLEKRTAFVGKDNVARLPRFREPDGYRPRRCVKVSNPHPDQLAVAATGHQCAANQIVEPAFRGIDDAPAFVLGQKVNNGRVGRAERLDLVPCLISCNATIVECMIEGGLENGKGAVCRCPTCANSVDVLSVDKMSFSDFLHDPARADKLGRGRKV